MPDSFSELRGAGGSNKPWVAAGVSALAVALILIALAAGIAAPDPQFSAVDAGPDRLDVSSYPPDQQARYPLFVSKCSRCHTLARPINTHFDAERWNRLNPEAKTPRKPYVTELLEGRTGPAIAATDYVRAFADQIRAFVPMRDTVLGTDGFGRSDYRRKLRHFFEVDRHWVTVAALKSLAEEGAVEPKVVADAILKYGIDCEKPNPMTF